MCLIEVYSNLNCNVLYFSMLMYVYALLCTVSVRYCILNAFIQMSNEKLCAFIYHCNIRLAEPLCRKNCLGKVKEKQFPPSRKETVSEKMGK